MDSNPEFDWPGDDEPDLAPTPPRDVLVKVLVYHWRKDNGGGCGCGWDVLGGSWPEHVADVYEDSLRAEPVTAYVVLTSIRPAPKRSYSRESQSRWMPRWHRRCGPDRGAEPGDDGAVGCYRWRSGRGGGLWGRPVERRMGRLAPVTHRAP